MKLKWFLKGLCIFWLTLLPISFSSAWNTVNPVWVGENLWSNNYCIIDSNLSFQCSLSDNVLTTQNESRSLSYFRLNNWLWIYQYSSNSNFYWQWIMTWFQFCSYHFDNNNFWTYWDWSVYNCLWKVYNYTEFRQYVSTHQLQAWWFLSNAGYYWFGGPVFIFEDWAFRATADSFQWNLNVYYWTFYTHNFWLEGLWLWANFSDINIKSNPITYVPWADNSSVSWSVNSAQNLYNTYVSMWYSDNLCYWWFALDDLFSTWNSNFRDISVWNWATIFQLYDTYSWGLAFSKWYNDYFVDYSFFIDYNDYYPFVWKSRWLLGMYLIHESFFKWDHLDPNLLYSFCAFSLTNDSNINKTQTPLDIINDTILNNSLVGLVWDIWIRIPVSWSALDIVANSVSWYTNFEDLWSWAYNAINSLQPVSSWSWALPAYIWLWFLAFCLLYLMKK